MHVSKAAHHISPKVLFLITKSNWGGAQKYVYDLATELNKGAWRVFVALGGSGEKGAEPGLLYKKLQEAGVHTFIIHSFMRNLSLLRDLHAVVEAYRLLVQVRPDILHLNSPKAAGIGSVAACVYNVFHRHHIHRVCTVHGWSFKEDRSALSRILIYLFSWLTSLLVESTIVITREDERLGKKMWLSGTRITLIHNGIHPPEFLSREEARKELLKGKTRSQTPEYWIGSIAELHPNKGLRYLLEASRTLSPSTLCILGEGEERSALEKIAQTLPHTVLFPGLVPDAARYLHAFDVFVLPSIKEGLPTVLLEAGFAGVPVIASNLESIHDIVRSREEGTLVPRKDTETLARALKNTIIDEVHTRAGAQKLQQHVMGSFSFEHMYKATTALYRQLLHSR